MRLAPVSFGACNCSNCKKEAATLAHQVETRAQQIVVERQAQARAAEIVQNAAKEAAKPLTYEEKIKRGINPAYSPPGEVQKDIDHYNWCCDNIQGYIPR